jgi:hypothetical protein
LVLLRSKPSADSIGSPTGRPARSGCRGDACGTGPGGQAACRMAAAYAEAVLPLASPSGPQPPAMVGVPDTG